MIKQGLCTSAKEEFLRGIHQPEDFYMLALYGEDAALDPDQCTIYTPDGEVFGKGYTPGGLPVKGFTTSRANGVATLTWAQPVIWYGCTITAAGGLIYNRSKDNRAIIALSFDDLIPAKNGVFSVSMPPSGSGALIVWG